MLNSLDPDHARHSVGPDLGPNCLQRLSANDKIRRCQVKSNDTCKDNRWLTYIIAINESCFCVIFHLMQTLFCHNLISQSTQTQHILINQYIYIYTCIYQKEELCSWLKFAKGNILNSFFLNFTRHLSSTHHPLSADQV